MGFCRLLYIKAFASQGQQYFCDDAYCKLLILKESVQKLRQMKQFFTIAGAIRLHKTRCRGKNTPGIAPGSLIQAWRSAP
jgi:hypothetical protein